MKKHAVCVAMLVLFATGCGTVGDQVLQDFGIQERPEGYVSGSDNVRQNMQVVGNTEMRRLNLAERRGEIKFETSDLDGTGVFYKEAKKYTKFAVLDAQPASRTSQGKAGGFVGYIQYRYEYMEGPRKSNRVEAESSSATIPSGRQGADTFRYRFNSGGVWNGSKGELTKK